MMSTQRAVVENGRISIDVDFPDGTEVRVILEADSDPLEEMDPTERARLDASIDRGLAQADASMGRPAGEIIAKLRSRR